MTIREVLGSFDDLSKKSFDENDVKSALDSIGEEELEPGDELKSELLAFSFAEGHRNEKTQWGTYFGPIVIWKNSDGTHSEAPSIQYDTHEMIDYWEKRARECKNPIMVARYSGLVWDFKKRITKQKPSYEIVRIYIKAIIGLASGDFHKHEVYALHKLERALLLTIELNDIDLIDLCKGAIISFENKYSKDELPGLWGYSFDLLIDNKKIVLTAEEENRIIDELEQRLVRLTCQVSEDQSIDLWTASSAAERLATYYRKKNKNEDVVRVLFSIDSTSAGNSQDVLAMQTTAWLEHLYKLYTKFDLQKEAKEVLQKIRAIGPRTLSEMKTFTQSFELPQKDVEDYITLMTSGDIQQVLLRITHYNIPVREKAKQQVLDQSKKHPFNYMSECQLYDEKGRVVATIGSIEDDLEGHIISMISKNLAYESPYLNMVIAELVKSEKLDESHIMLFIEQSPIISKDRIRIIEAGINAYFLQDYLVAIHLLIPQIEEAIRNIIEFGGGNVLKPSKAGGYHLKTFDEILRDEITTKSLGEDLANYFRVLFTDQRGWNLRNAVCHGTFDLSSFNAQFANRVLHAILCLGLIRKRTLA